MKKKPPHGAERDILEPDLSAALAGNLQRQPLPPEVEARVRDRLMSRITGQRQFFVFANQGEWETVGPGIQIKLLQDNATCQSFLLHMAEQSVLPSHQHEAHEEAFVVEGEVWLDGVRCTQGDYHFAAAGTFHGEVHTKKGCTLLMKTTAAS